MKDKAEGHVGSGLSGTQWIEREGGLYLNEFLVALVSERNA
jgi:hypothetical protein